MTPAAALALKVETVFSRIHETRMRDMPLLNPALAVEAVGFRPWQRCWLGALVTPWSMNLFLSPVEATDEHPTAIGQTRTHRFPAGRFDFVGGYEPDIGPYATCSLYSPVTEFTDQAAAVATAASALALLLDERTAHIEDADIDATDIATAPRGISRRELLRGRLRGAG